MYTIKEAFYSLQGEGAHAGRPSVFCRFSGCNLWNGKESSRAISQCQFCDTDFIGHDGQNGGKFKDALSLAQHLNALWPIKQQHKYIVFTGGEPALQLDEQLIETIKAEGFEIAIETNGTKPLPKGIDWICVSPKTKDRLLIDQGDELKLVYPQETLPPHLYEHLNFTHFYLQPMDMSYTENTIIPSKNTTDRTLNYCLNNPQWKLSLQTHKMLNID